VFPWPPAACPARPGTPPGSAPCERVPVDEPQAPGLPAPSAPSAGRPRDRAGGAS